MKQPGNSWTDVLPLTGFGSKGSAAQPTGIRRGALGPGAERQAAPAQPAVSPVAVPALRLGASDSTPTMKRQEATAAPLISTHAI